MRPEAAMTFALFAPNVALTSADVARLIGIGPEAAFARLAKLSQAGLLDMRRVAQRGNLYALPGDQSLVEADRGGWWTDARCETLRILRAEGLSSGDIARRMETTAGAVRARLGRMRLKKPGPPPITVDWTADLVGQLRHQHALGLNDREIAEAIGVSHAAVRGKRTRLHLAAVEPKAREPVEPAQRPPAAPARRREADPQAFVAIDPSHRPWTTRKLGECKWPIDMPDGEEMHSCCLPVKRAGYCAAHAARAFVASTYVPKLRDPSPRRRA